MTEQDDAIVRALQYFAAGVISNQTALDYIRKFDTVLDEVLKEGARNG